MKDFLKNFLGNATKGGFTYSVKKQLFVLFGIIGVIGAIVEIINGRASLPMLGAFLATTGGVYVFGKSVEK